MATSPNFIAAPPITATHDSKIARRWLEWQPALIMEARRGVDPATALQHFKTIHRSRLIDLTAAGIPWTSILRNQLDNPLLSTERFELLMQAALKRSVTIRGREHRKRNLAIERSRVKSKG